MIDAYTLKPIRVESEEHILLNALGGKWKAPLLDKTTNDKFGETIDKELTLFANPIRTWLDARSGDNKSPPKLKSAETSTGEQFNVLAGGRPEMVKPKVTIQTVPHLRVEGHFRSEKEMRHHMSRPSAELNIPMDRFVKATETRREPVGVLWFDVSLSDVARRSLAKMVGNLLAHLQWELWRTAAFDAARAFVLDGVGKLEDFVVVAPTSCAATRNALGPLDHLLIVRGSPSERAVDGLVVLFGYIEFAVRLANVSPPSPFVHSYRVDQLGRSERRDDPLDQSAMPLFDRARRYSHQATTVAFRLALAAVRDVIEEEQRKRLVADEAAWAAGDRSLP